MSLPTRYLRRTMRRPASLGALGLCAALLASLPVIAQVTPAFTYQGELRSAGVPANASFDMEFRLFDAAMNGAQIGPLVTRTNVPAANGLFSVQLDFGAAQFAGDRQWLEVRIKPAASGSFETLAPRTEVTAAPYALGAVAALPNSVTTTSIVDGTIGTTDINATQIQRRVSGVCAAGQYVRTVGQDGTVTCGTDAVGTGTVTSVATGAGLAGGPVTTTGTISLAPGGIGTTEIDATQVQRRVTGTCSGTNYLQQLNQDGTVVCGPAPAPNSWSLTGNAGTNASTNFIGSTDAQPFVVRTQNVRSLRIEPSTVLFNGSPITTNMIAGSSANEVGAGVRGATIAGGGVPSGDSDPGYVADAPNRVTDDYGTVGGGYGNRSGNDASPTNDGSFATVSGGLGNTASGFWSTVGGGEANVASGVRATVAGGAANTASGSRSTVSGGQNNTAGGSIATVGGGQGNTASAFASTISGGNGNVAPGSHGTVAGGVGNCAGGDYSWAGGSRAKVRPASAPAGPLAACSNLTYPGGTGDEGTFVWADTTTGDFVSTAPSQFLVRAANGFGLNTNDPIAAHATIGKNDFSNNTISIGFAGNATRWRIGGTGAGTGAAFEVQSGGDQVLLRVEDAGLAARVGISRTAAANALEVEGNASKTTAGDWLANSDARIKTDVRPIGGAVDRLMQVRPVTFRYTPAYLSAHPGIADQTYFNVIAQEYAQVYPDAVQRSGEHVPGHAKTAANEVLQVDIHPAMITTIAAVQELAVRLALAEAARDALAGELTRLASENATLRAGQTRSEAQNADMHARLMRLEAMVGGDFDERR